jgi:hypothetical protein
MWLNDEGEVNCAEELQEEERLHEKLLDFQGKLRQEKRQVVEGIVCDSM